MLHTPFFMYALVLLEPDFVNQSFKAMEISFGLIHRSSKTCAANFVDESIQCVFKETMYWLVNPQTSL